MRLASRLRQDALDVFTRQSAQLDADRQSALQLGQQVGRFRDVKRAGGDEEDMIGLHRAVLRRDCRAFDQRQQIALHAFARDVGAAAHAVAARIDLVDLVEEDDAVVLDRRDRLGGNLVVVDQLVALFGDQNVEAVLDRDAARLCALAECLSQHLADD